MKTVLLPLLLTVWLAPPRAGALHAVEPYRGGRLTLEVTSDDLDEIAGLDNISRLSDREFVFNDSNVLWLVRQLGQMGWRVSLTEDRLFATKGDLFIRGIIGADSTQLKVGSNRV